MTEFAIRVQGLSKCYHVYDRPQDRLKQSLWRGRKQFYREFWALRDVSLEVGKGETVGIIGRNGSGKSTLLQMIAGTLTPTTGTVQVNGRVAALLELGSGFNPDFTGRENVYMNGAILGLSEAEIAARFDEIAAFAGIGDFIEQPVKTYSSGMMLRLAFAVSVCVDPDILIIDEALAVGDMAFQYKCMKQLERLTQSGTTLLFVSHDLGTVKAFCQKAVYLAKGTLRASGSASDLAELYMLDVKDEQKKAIGDGVAVQIKKPLDQGKGIAFGTHQGRVLQASFTGNSGNYAALTTGEKVGIEVEVEYDATLLKPAVSMILCDYRMIELFGRYVSIGHRAEANSVARAKVEFNFPADINTGNYYITVRLEDRAADNDLVPIDKQVGALSLSVTRPLSNHFIGVMDVPIEANVMPLE